MKKTSLIRIFLIYLYYLILEYLVIGNFLNPIYNNLIIYLIVALFILFIHVHSNTGIDYDRL